MNRGNRKATIFEDERDRRRFLRILIEEQERYAVETLGGCQMGNHFHLLVNTPNANLSDFMERLEGRFACYSNWRHCRVGHLFQGRFRDVAIEHDIHLLIALCYIFLNPVSAGLVSRPEDYRWSTYAATVGLAPLPGYLSIDWLEALFPDESLAQAQRRLRTLMTDAKPGDAYLHQNDFDVDPQALKVVMRSYVGEHLHLGMLPRLYRSALRFPLSDLFSEGIAMPARASAIYDAHVIHGYKMAEIARHLGIHRNTVSRIFRSICNSRRM